MMDWDKYFLEGTEWVSTGSKDPSTKVGCIIVDEENRPVSFGFNGFVAGSNNLLMTWKRPMKYHLIIHAEMNAILFARQSLNNTKLYASFSPCENCLKHILQAGVRYIRFRHLGPTAERGTQEQREALLRLLRSVENLDCKCETGETYVDLIQEKINEFATQARLKETNGLH